MKNITTIGQQRLKMALEFDKGIIPSDEDIMEYILNKEELVIEDTFKLANRLLIEHGILFKVLGSSYQIRQKTFIWYIKDEPLNGTKVFQLKDFR